MRVVLSILVPTYLATCLLCGQELPPPIPGEEAPRPEPPKVAEVAEVATPPGGVDARKVTPLLTIPLGLKEAKPAVPTIEHLLQSSESAKVSADSMWITIEHAKRRGVTSIDVGRDGVCHLIERDFGESGQGDAVIVRSGKSLPTSIRATMMGLARQKGILFGIGRDRLLLGTGGDQLRIGVASNHGRSVHTSPSAAFDEYPAEVREAATALLSAARKLPLLKDVKAVVSTEFVDPRRARRLTALEGQRLIVVDDPDRDATLLPPAVAAARMPGRKIVVRDALEWEEIRSYLSAAGLDPDIDGHCLISVGSQTYRLSVEVLGQP